jgi:hypothetical protein
VIVINVFIKEIFKAAEKAPLSPAPITVLFRVWGSTGSFQPDAMCLVMGFMEVRIRIN